MNKCCLNSGLWKSRDLWAAWLAAMTPPGVIRRWDSCHTHLGIGHPAEPGNSKHWRPNWVSVIGAQRGKEGATVGKHLGRVCMLESENWMGFWGWTEGSNLGQKGFQTGQIIVHTVTIIIYRFEWYLAASVLVFVAEIPEASSQAQAQAQQLHCRASCSTVCGI